VDSIRRMLLPLSAVVGVPNGAVGTVRIIHVSFREFMISTIKDRRPDLLCGTNQQQCTVAFNLLRIMQNELKFNVCKLPTSYLRNGEMPGIQERLHRYISTHLRYSCRFWAEHIAGTSFNLDLDQEVRNLLLDKLLFWLEVLSLLGMVGHASRALSRIIAWTKVQIILLFISFSLTGVRTNLSSASP
jgi:hypothetical protein